MKSENITDIEMAIEIFEEISDWKDSKEKVVECKKKIEKICVEKEERKQQRKQYLKQLL